MAPVNWPGRASLPALYVLLQSALGLEDRDDFECLRIHHQDLIADQDEFISAPLRIDAHDLRRERAQAHTLARNAGADRDLEVDIVDRRNVLIPDHGGDLGALLGRELGGRASLARRRRGLRLGFRVHVAVAVAGLGVLIPVAAFAGLGVLLPVAAFAALGVLILVAALGLHVVLPAFATLGLHVLTALGLVLRAHALRLLTRGVFFAALALANRR